MSTLADKGLVHLTQLESSFYPFNFLLMQGP